jgi:hypothetical protein
MRFQRVLVFALAAAVMATTTAAVRARAQSNPFLGNWNITGDPPNTANVYWLQVKDEGGTLSALFLNRGGSPVAAKDVKIANGELTFTMGGDNPKNVVRLKEAGGKLTGTVGETAIKVTGERPPTWAACDANAAHTFGKPVVLFDGKTVDAWTPQNKDKALMWSVADGAMTNEPHGNNLVSKEKFKDFKVEAEYKVSPKGNSGIYLRGRYEMQVLDDAGADSSDAVHGHMAIYSRKAPEKNVSKPAGEWQTAQITIVGNCVTAVLNGTTIHSNSKITGITGGALDAKETEPGPIVIQGDHEKVWFRKVVVTPITK